MTCKKWIALLLFAPMSLIVKANEYARFFHLDEKLWNEQKIILEINCPRRDLLISFTNYDSVVLKHPKASYYWHGGDVIFDYLDGDLTVLDKNTAYFTDNISDSHQYRLFFRFTHTNFPQFDFSGINYQVKHINGSGHKESIIYGSRNIWFWDNLMNKRKTLCRPVIRKIDE